LKVLTQISYVFRYAIDQGIEGAADWTQQFHRAYSSPPSKNLACLTKQSDIAQLMKSIDDYRSVNVITALALKFSALTIARPGEIRRAEWPEIDFSDNLWRIPAEKMKARQPHLVPLAPQTLALLEELKPITGHSRLLFQGFRGQDRPISEITVLSALRRMGYSKEKMCAHGFRGMASTALNEKGWNRDWIERRLAHEERNKIRGAYNHTDFLPSRRQMMDWWAAYLNALQNDRPAPALPF
jgi:integrase